MATTELGLTNDFAPGDPYPAAQATAVADALDAASAAHLSVAFTVGAEAGNVIAVTVQAQTNGGDNIATETPIQATLVDSNSKTADLTGTAPSGGWAAGTGRLRRSYTANKDAEFVTAPNGAVRIDITHSTAKTWYLVVVIGSRVYISPAITFV